MKLRHKTLVRAGIVSAVIAGAALVAAPVAMAAGTLSGLSFLVNPATDQNLNSGGSQTPFGVKVPQPGSNCSGDSNHGYFVSGYVTAQNDPQNLTFDAGGNPAGTGVTYPLIDATHSAYAQRNVAPTTGQVLPTGPLTWSDFDTTSLPPGTYHIGLACTLTSAGVVTMDRFWDTTIQFVADSGDPGGFTWQTVPNPQVPEFPIVILLPISAGLLVAGGAFVLRRRRQDASSLAS